MEASALLAPQSWKLKCEQVGHHVAHISILLIGPEEMGLGHMLMRMLKNTLGLSR